MALIDLVYRFAYKIGLKSRPGIAPFEAVDGQADTLAEQAADGLPSIFFKHRGRAIYRWAHYTHAYEAHFASFRRTPVRLLEIGVLNGGSLDMWRDYFGDAATIFGVDIDPACADRVTAPNQVRLGSQADSVFLAQVVAEMGGVDIVIDDGSHVASHQRASFKALFPLLADGGFYAIEDMHTAYWPGYHQGGYGRRGTAIDLVKQMLDDMHGWHHDRPRPTTARDEVGALHIYESLAIVAKRRNRRPVHVTTPA